MVWSPTTRDCVEPGSVAMGTTGAESLALLSLLSTVYSMRMPLGERGGVHTTRTGCPLLPDTNGADRPSGTAWNKECNEGGGEGGRGGGRGEGGGGGRGGREGGREGGRTNHPLVWRL